MNGSLWTSWGMGWILLGILAVTGLGGGSSMTQPAETSATNPRDIILSYSICPQPGGQAPRIHPTASLSEFESLLKQYLDALNTPWGLAELINLQHVTSVGQVKYYRASTTWQDLTGDGVAEVVLWLYHPETDSGSLFIFGCKDGAYKTIFKKTPYVALIAVRDMNDNGLPEVVLSERDCTIGCLTYFSLLEWHEKNFTNQAQVSEPPCYGPCITEGYAQIVDLNQDGWYELEIVNEPSPLNGPGRAQIQIWAWEGNFYSLQEIKYTEPKYRIHAIYAGDDAAAAGLFDEAWGYYQRVIFEPGLLPARNWATNQLPNWDAVETLEERQVLSAYARYRIMHLFLAQGYISDAGVVYGYLQAKFPPGVAGHIYTEMATQMWEGYQASGSLAFACNRAIEFAKEHPSETLDVLGQAFYGGNNRNYLPEDICPILGE
jgi:hypothetical protein